MTVNLGKGQFESADRLKRETTQGGNGRWLFGHYIQNNGDNLAHGVRRQAPYDAQPAGNAEASTPADAYNGGATAPTTAPVSANNAGYGPSGSAPTGGAPKAKAECCACQIGPADKFTVDRLLICVLFSRAPGDSGVDGAPGLSLTVHLSIHLL